MYFVEAVDRKGAGRMYPDLESKRHTCSCRSRGKRGITFPNSFARQWARHSPLFTRSIQPRCSWYQAMVAAKPASNST